MAVFLFFNRRVLHKASQQSVQRIFGSLRLRQAFFWLQVFSTSQAESQPAQNPLTQTVGTPRAKVNHFENVKLGLAKSTA
jgi:phytoene dehydrogenase-like protein